MSLTLNQALQIHPLNQSTILAGRNGLNCIVDRIGVLDAPDSVNFVKPNEFVMTTGYIFKESPDCQLNVIEELHKRGAAGLGIKISRYLSNFLPEIINFANEHCFPLIALPNEYSWHEISTPILLESIYKKQTIDQELFDSIRDMAEKISNTSSFEEILYFFYEIIKIPCSLYNVLDNTIINYPSDFILPKGIDYIMSDLYVSPNSITIYSSFKRISDIDGLGNSAVIAPITFRGSNLGYIIVWENSKILTYEELSVLHFSIMSIRLHFRESHNPMEELMSAQNIFLYTLLSQDIENIDTINFRAGQLGIKLVSGYIVEAISIYEKDNSGDLLPISESAFNKIKNNIYNISRKLEVLSCMGKVGEAFFMIPMMQYTGTDKEKSAIKLRAIGLKNELESSMPGIVLSFGVGKYYPNLNGLKLSHNEATISLELGVKLYGKGSITHFVDLGVFRFLSNPDIANELKCFVDDHIAPLIRFDKENNSELLKTLQVFLKSGRIHRQCAKEMFVHHNTVRYRLAQIQEICKIDIDSPENLLVLEMALKMLLLDNMSDM